MLFLNVLLSTLLVSAANPIQQILAVQINTMLKSPSFIGVDSLKSTLNAQLDRYRPPPIVQDQPVLPTAISVPVQQTFSTNDAAGALKVVECLALGGNYEAIECLNEIAQHQESLISDSYNTAFVKFHGQWRKDEKSEKLEALTSLLSCDLSIASIQSIIDFIIRNENKEKTLENKYAEAVANISKIRKQHILAQQTPTKLSGSEILTKMLIWCIPCVSAACCIVGFGLIFLPSDISCTGTTHMMDILNGKFRQWSSSAVLKNPFNITSRLEGNCQLNGQQQFTCSPIIPYGPAVITFIIGILGQIFGFITNKPANPDWSFLQYHEKFQNHVMGPSLLAAVKLGTTIKLIAGEIVPQLSGNVLATDFQGVYRELDFQFDSQDSGFLDFTEAKKEEELKKYLREKLNTR